MAAGSLVSAVAARPWTQSPANRSLEDAGDGVLSKMKLAAGWESGQAGREFVRPERLGERGRPDAMPSTSA